MKRLKLHYSIFFVFFVMGVNLHAQTTEIDSLRSTLTNFTNIDTNQIKVLIRLSSRFYNINVDSALKYAQKAYSLSNSINYGYGKAKTLNLLGACYFKKSDYPKAVDYFKKSLTINDSLNNKPGLANTYNNIGASYKIQGNYPQALEYFQKSLSIEKALNHKTGIAGSYNNIGIIFDIQENYPKALKYYLKASDFYSELNDTLGISNAYHNIGVNYYTQGMYLKALEYFQKSLEMFKKQKNKSGMAWSYFNIGKIYRVKKQYTKAINFFQKSIKLSIETGNKSIEANNYKELGLLYLASNKPNKANFYAQKAYLIAKTIENTELLNSVTGILATSYAELGMYKKAYDYHVKYKNLNDSIYNNDNIRKLTKLEYQYKYEKEKEVEKLNQKKKNEIMVKELKFQTTIKYILILSLIIAIIISFLFILLYKDKKKANSLLTTKNKEILKQQELISKQNIEIKKHSEELLKHKNNLEATVQKRTAELLKAKEKAEESDRLKSAFLNNVSHEFRTPMNGIIGFSTFLTEPDLPPEIQEEYAHLLNQSCQQLLNTVNDTVEISKVHSHQTEVTTSVVNIVNLLNKVIDNFNDFVEQKSLKIKFYNNIEEPDSKIITDGYKLERIVWHLIDNAIKFSYSGQINVTLKTNKNNQLYFQVKDMGIGIPDELQNKIFDPYHQVETGLTKRFGGVGIGLSLTKAYVTILGGDISLKSIPEKGTSVIVTLPFKKIPADSKTDDKKPLGNINKKTILIAEDNELNYLLLESILLKFKTTLLHAWNGKQAIEILEENDVDVILMDLKMPVMDGYEAISEIKRRHPELPIIVQTAYTVHAELKDLNKINFDGYITKPIKVSNLINVLKQVL